MDLDPVRLCVALIIGNGRKIDNSACNRSFVLHEWPTLGAPRAVQIALPGPPAFVVC